MAPSERQYLRAFPSGQTRLSVDETSLRALPSGQTRISPDETALLSLPSGKSHDLPDGRPLRLAHQFHFGSQCATESVYRYLPAKVELKKSHFGKPPSVESAVRQPLCQNELAEVPAVLFAPTASLQTHPEDNAIHGLVEGTISLEMEGSVRGVCLLRATNYWCASLSRSRTTFTGLKVSTGTSIKAVSQSDIAPFHRPGSSSAFNSRP